MTHDYKAWLRFGVAGLAALLCVALASSAAEPPAPPNPELLKDVTIVIFGQPYTGTLLQPATETDFSFQVKGSPEVLTFRWASLEESERRRVQKLFGIGAAGEAPRPAWGEQLKCVRLKLKNGRVIEGLERPEQAHSGFRCIKTPTQLLQVPQPDIAQEESTIGRESDVYSPEEGYELLLARKPPAKDSAADQLEAARACVEFSLWDKALDHLDMATSIDPRTEERSKDLRAQVVMKRVNEQTTRLFHDIQLAAQRQDYAVAAAKCDEFLRNFPLDERRTQVEALKAELGPKRDTHFARQVVALYYQFANDLLQARLARRTQVDEQGRPVPAEPGKLVTTRAGRTFRGKLLAEDADKITIKQEDMTCEVPRKDIAAVQDVDISKGARAVDPTFAELKAYATADKGGLGGDVVTRISQVLQADEAKVREAWANRLVRTAVLQDGRLIQPPLYTSLHTAGYGKGTWLREGMTDVGGQGATPPRRVGPARGLRRGAAARQPDPKDQPELSDDPEIWWRVQKGDTKYDILRAFAAEKLYKVRELRELVCAECAGRGYIVVFGDPEPRQCNVCRGLKHSVTVVYE